MADSCFKKQQYFGNNVWEAIFLVVSNLPLLIVVIRAWIYGFRTRAYLFMMAFLASFLYHVCLIRGGGGLTCVLNFCTLKLLDYMFSYTTLFSAILLFIPFTAFHSKKKNLSQAKSRLTVIKPNVSYVEDWIIFGTITAIGLLVGEINNFDSLSWLQVGVILFIYGVILGIGWTILFVQYGKKPEFDVIDLIFFVIFGLIAIFFFLIEYLLPASSYGYTHSLWHIFGSLALLYAIESRNKTVSGIWVIFTKCYCLANDKD
jgi:hypothetical protein